jgi:hypothetical protein
MKNLTKKLIVPLVLAGALVAGCATYSTPYNASNINKQTSSETKKHLINLKNGYFAESSETTDTIDLITSALLGEVILIRTNHGEYMKRNSGKYLESGEEAWNSTFNQSCKDADIDKNNILEENEVNDLLDSTYDSIHKHDNDVIWVEEE